VKEEKKTAEEVPVQKEIREGKESPVQKETNRKNQALEMALAQIDRQFGKGYLRRLGDTDVLDVQAIPSGSLSLDAALGIGGFPRGRVVEIYGQEASGKTTLALHVVAEAQKRGGTAAFIDVEHALDPKYAKKIGVDVENLYISQPDYGEQALEIAETLIRSNAVDVVVLDSVAALVPKAELEGEMGDAHMGLQARLMSQALRKLTAIVSRSKSCLIFINQLREKIGMFVGNPETTTGGRALKFYASVRIDVKKILSIKQGEEIVGSQVRAKVVKNKLASPFKEAIFDIIYGEGISKEGEIIEIGSEMGLVEKSGTWFSIKGQRLGQGKENVRKLLRENKELSEELEKLIREKLNIPYIP